MAPKQYHITARIHEFRIPPVHDGLILGKEASIGCTAIREALGLLSSSSYAHIEIEDDTISDIILKEGILKRIPEDRLSEFVLANIKPHMMAKEIMHIDFDVELLIESMPT